MSKLEEYNELIEQKKKVEQAIKIFEESAVIKDYLELTEEKKNLQKEETHLYKEMKKEQYASCEHITVYSSIEHDRTEGRTYKDCGCIKCGLDTRALDLDCDSNFLSPDKKIMYDYFQKNSIIGSLKGINTEIVCDLDLAKAIYSKIKEAHPNIDDETAIKYFEIALDNIRNIPVNEERKISRARRLSLFSNFNRWNGSDVHHSY